jgi:polysaccharide biosynthesis/export protein
LLKQIAFVSVAVLLSGCSSLPRSGPSDQRIMQNAAASMTVADQGTALQYALVDLTANVLALVPPSNYGSLSATFGLRGGAPASLPIGLGDNVQITIFESSDGGLFIPAGGGGSSGNYVTLPSQTVSASGVINVPFAGTVQARGLTIPQLEETIRARLEDKALEPQVIVALTRQSASEVTVIGDVNSSQRVTLSEAGERILDVIARAGGLSEAPYDTTVTLTRAGRRGEIDFGALASNSNENVYLMPGDVVLVASDTRTFTAFGSTGLTGEFEFDAESITLESAVAKAGGLLDGRADPRQVFLYRIESRHVLEQMGVNLAAFPVDQQSIPTIYRANFADPASFFLSGQFPMHDGDVIYISNADAVEVTKFVNVVNGVSSAVSSPVSTARNVRDFVESF